VLFQEGERANEKKSFRHLPTVNFTKLLHRRSAKIS
jgi:hypothetical protein